MDGHLTYEEFQKAMELSIDASNRIYEMQRDALRRRYAVTLEEILRESPPAPPETRETVLESVERMEESAERRDMDFGPEGI